MKLDNTNRILFSDGYQGYLQDLHGYEKERIFCKHDLQHFIDVGRIFYIKILEEGLTYSKDLAYTTALLHDIGRVREHEDGVDHREASLAIAKELLPLTDFSQEEQDIALEAIAHHGKESSQNPFVALFYQADKLSRLCFQCPAWDPCYWSLEKKNHHLKY